MRRVASLVALALASLTLASLTLAACGPDALLSDRDLDIRLVTETTEVQVGEGFALDVVRAWRRNLAPDAWDDGLLDPLVVRTQTVQRDDDGRHIRETRRLLAYAFTSGELSIPGPTLTAAPVEGGAARTARADSLTLHVTTELDAAEPGDPELPGGPISGESPWIWWLLLGAAGLVGMALMARARRVDLVVGSEVALPPTVSLSTHALERIATLRGMADVEALHDGVALTLREYLAAARGIGSPQSTTEELLRAATPELAGPHADALSELLRRCDGVKFAARRPPETACAKLLDDAVELVGGMDAA